MRLIPKGLVDFYFHLIVGPFYDLFLGVYGQDLVFSLNG